MGARRPDVRDTTRDLFNQTKWVMLIRDKPEQDWRFFGNKLSNSPYIYGNLDKAGDALKTVQGGRYKAGNAKLVKADQFGLGIDPDDYKVRLRKHKK